MISVNAFFNALVRRKPLDPDTGLSSTLLDRCLTTFDLTTLGIGSTLGLGVYVLAGQVASSTAGPSVIISFLIAAIVSVFAGLCYAEFGARVPKAGSAYVYSYISVGEFMAFIIGWNLILEYIIGTASVARGYSGYLDSLFDNTIQNHLRSWMPMDVEYISSYPDLLAFGITLLLTVMLAVGVKESTRFNSIFTILNLTIVTYAVIVGSFRLDFANWNYEPTQEEEGSKEIGKGGFFPFGIEGMMQGAATCFYAYVGFDAIATTGEEVKDPQKSIPISIIVSLFFISLAYSGVSIVSTLMVPYFLQHSSAPLPLVFELVGFRVAKWVITIGALAGLSTSLLGAMFPLPRVLYAMGNDKLIFKFMANVSPKFKTPFIATLIAGFFAGVMAAMFDVEELANMMSIGTLLAYTLVAVSVLILRYKDESSLNFPVSSNNQISGQSEINSEEVKNFPKNALWRQLFFNLNGYKTPNSVSSKASNLTISAIGATMVALNVLLVSYQSELYRWKLPSSILIAMSILTVIIIILFIGLLFQPMSQRKVSFKVPLVPFIPILSLFCNTNLMFQLPTMTWYRFAVWMFLGFLIYFGYGIRKSVGYIGDNEREILSEANFTNNGFSASSSSNSVNTNFAVNGTSKTKL